VDLVVVEAVDFVEAVDLVVVEVVDLVVVEVVDLVVVEVEDLVEEEAPGGAVEEVVFPSGDNNQLGYKSCGNPHSKEVKTVYIS